MKSKKIQYIEVEIFRPSFLLISTLSFLFSYFFFKSYNIISDTRASYSFLREVISINYEVLYLLLGIILFGCGLAFIIFFIIIKREKELEIKTKEVSEDEEE